MSSWMYEVCDYLRRCSWFVCRHPAYSSEFIGRKIDKPTTERRELLVYKLHCTNGSKRWALVLSLVCVLYSLKNFYAVYESLNLYDYQHIERNIRQLNGTHKSISSCLVTNCTRLSNSLLTSQNLAEDASKLPMFLLCHPQMAPHFPVFISLGYFGIFITLLVSYTVLALGNTTRIQQFVAPAESELIMHLTAPRVTYNLIHERAREFVGDFVNSYENFRSGRRKNIVTQSQCGLMRYKNIEWIISEESTLNYDDKFISNCLPAIRSEWWRKRSAKLLITHTMLCTTCIILVLILVIHLSSAQAVKREKLLQSFGEEMQNLNCFIWTDDGTSSSQQVDLNHLKVQWSWYSLIEFILVYGIPCLICSLLFGHFFGFIIETFIRLAEARAFLVATLMAARLHNNASNYQHVNWSARRLKSTTRACYTIANLRRHFRESIAVKLGLFVLARHRICKNHLESLLITSTCNDRHQERQFVREMILALQVRARDDTEFNIDTMEQIYVHFHLYVDHIRSLPRNFTIVIVITFSIDYGYLLLGVIGHHKFSSMTTFETLFLIISAWIFANLFIYFSASVHANNRKLEPLIWSIIAQLTCWRSTRARHLRALWLKQVVMLDNEGGLALTALGMRVTYGYIIKLMLWTATALVIAFKPD